MSLAYFIAKRIYRDNDKGKRVSRPAVFIAMVGIAIGLAVMIISVSVAVGFKTEVRNKVVGFGSHIIIANLDAVNSYETRPVFVGDSMMTALYHYPEVKHVQRYSTKPGMIKTKDSFQGIVLKGMGQEFDPAFIKKCLIAGSLPAFSDSVSSSQVLVSKAMADKMKLHVGDKIYTYYIQDDIRARRFKISGIYQTNFSDYDNLFLLTDIYTVNRLNKWYPGQVSGLELQVNNYDKLDDITYRIAFDTNSQHDKYGGVYYVRNIRQLNPQIFAWLDLLNINVWVILLLMIGIAGFTMISGLLIIIIERANMIGILKALGAGNFVIRKTFLWLAVFLIGKGMLWGNIIGLGFYFIQSQFGLLKLDPETYYVDTVPVNLNIWFFLLINIGTLLASVFMLLGPSFLISKINPANSMRYD
ncbi:MAG: ABC transporter permease [Bacteroidaceae bacterium]|nr:ABC transporter permease [Bacteroidaceae bacterium]